MYTHACVRRCSHDGSTCNVWYRSPDNVGLMENNEALIMHTFMCVIDWLRLNHGILCHVISVCICIGVLTCVVGQN